jgi:radical SAM protein with 4Fe4S-binding SPASM domain
MVTEMSSGTQPTKPASKRFSKVNIEISNICNLQCSFCPEVVRTKKLMDEALFEKIIKEVAPLTDQVCFHLMGEPLVHPKLERFLEICTREQLPVNLVSNGVLLTDKRAELLLNPIVRQVNFSLHSFNDNYPEKDHAEYLEKIFKFTEAAFEKRPDLYINFRLWNLPRVNEVENPVQQKNRAMLGAVEQRFGVELASRLDADFDVRLQKSYKVKNRLYLHFDTEFVWPSLDLPTLGMKGTCKGLINHFGVLAEGTVVPCCLDKEAKIPLGNALEQSIPEILDSPRAKEILKGFRERRLVEELCQKCQYIQRFN